MNDQAKKEGQQASEEPKTVEVSDKDLAPVAGGTALGFEPGTVKRGIAQDVTSKAKTADKAYAAMDAYIRN